MYRLQSGACAVAAVVLPFTEAGIGGLYLFGTLAVLYATVAWSQGRQGDRQ